MRSSFNRALAAVILAGSAACRDNGPSAQPLLVSFSSQTAAAMVTEPAAAMDITVSGGGNTLVITKAQLVVRRIKLKPSTGNCSDDDVEGSDDCANVFVGPVLVDLPLTTNSVATVNAAIPEGTYRRIEFKIHKPSDESGDAAFKSANPTFANISIRVQGTYNGSAFVYTSALTEKQTVNLDPALTINAANQNVTISVDVSTWFKSGSNVIDPSTANSGGTNENLVRNNIRASLRAFEDPDRNGR